MSTNEQAPIEKNPSQIFLENLLALSNGYAKARNLYDDLQWKQTIAGETIQYTTAQKQAIIAEISAALTEVADTVQVLQASVQNIP